MFEDIKQKYNTIVIDPPWDISMTGKTALRPNRSKELPYKTMSLEEIKKIPINKIANQGTHIYCWTTNKMLKDTYDVLKSWGVNFHLVLVWTKPSGIAPCFAYQFATEFVLLGFFGKPMQKFKKNCQLNWIQATPVRNGHSAKPDEFYKLIREMSPEPMIDIFARKPRVGFDVWGDEIASPETQAILSESSFNKDLTEFDKQNPKSATQTSLNQKLDDDEIIKRFIRLSDKDKFLVLLSIFSYKKQEKINLKEVMDKVEKINLKEVMDKVDEVIPSSENRYS